MQVVVDSSTLISLAWSGRLDLLELSPLELLVPSEVQVETVTNGLAHGYPDAAAIEGAIKQLGSMPPVGQSRVDDAVLQAGRTIGALLSNDVALGRRAANLGVLWLRTADLVVVCVRAGRLHTVQGVAALLALHSAGRITDRLLDAYREELQ